MFCVLDRRVGRARLLLVDPDEVGGHDGAALAVVLGAGARHVGEAGGLPRHRPVPGGRRKEASNLIFKLQMCILIISLIIY